jgi:molybdopterin adenylyltransferase
MPGKPKAIEECLQVIFPAIPYCIDLVGGPHLETDPSVMKAFRPKPK